MYTIALVASVLFENFGLTILAKFAVPDCTDTTNLIESL